MCTLKILEQKTFDKICQAVIRGHSVRPLIGPFINLLKCSTNESMVLLKNPGFLMKTPVLG